MKFALVLIVFVCVFETPIMFTMGWSFSMLPFLRNNSGQKVSNILVPYFGAQDMKKLKDKLEGSYQKAENHNKTVHSIRSTGKDSDEDGLDLGLDDFSDEILQNMRKKFEDYGHLRFGKRTPPKLSKKYPDPDYGHLRFGK